MVCLEQLCLHYKTQPPPWHAPAFRLDHGADYKATELWEAELQMQRQIACVDGAD
jgi:hypothetical protein